MTGMLYCHYKTLSSVLSNVEVYSGGPTSRPRQKISRVDSAKKATHQIMELLVLFAQPLWCCLASLVTLCRRPEMCQEFLLQSKRYYCCARRPRGPTSFCTSRQNLKAFFFNFNKLESKSELLLVLQNFLSNLTSYCCTGCPGRFEISKT